MQEEQRTVRPEKIKKTPETDRKKIDPGFLADMELD